MADVLSVLDWIAALLFAGAIGLIALTPDEIKIARVLVWGGGPHFLDTVGYVGNRDRTILANSRRRRGCLWGLPIQRSSAISWLASEEGASFSSAIDAPNLSKDIGYSG
jgi:hypothetical protein